MIHVTAQTTPFVILSFGVARTRSMQRTIAISDYLYLCFIISILCCKLVIVLLQFTDLAKLFIFIVWVER